MYCTNKAILRWATRNLLNALTSHPNALSTATKWTKPNRILRKKKGKCPVFQARKYRIKTDLRKTSSLIVLIKRMLKYSYTRTVISQLQGQAGMRCTTDCWWRHPSSLRTRSHCTKSTMNSNVIGRSEMKSDGLRQVVNSCQPTNLIRKATLVWTRVLITSKRAATGQWTPELDRTTI